MSFPNIEEVEAAIFRWCHDQIGIDDFNAWLYSVGLAEPLPDGGPVLFDPDHPLLAAECRRRFPDCFIAR